MGLRRIEAQYMGMLEMWYTTLAFAYLTTGVMNDREAYAMTRVCHAKA